jgi:hypothetical protein
MTAPDAAGPALSQPEIEEKLAEMLTVGVVFVSGQLDTLCVNANDFFYWGCADAEPLRLDQVESFWAEWKAGRRGEWLCVQRSMRPQTPMMEHLKERGEWTAIMEAFPVRTDA